MNHLLGPLLLRGKYLNPKYPPAASRRPCYPQSLLLETWVSGWMSTSWTLPAWPRLFTSSLELTFLQLIDRVIPMSMIQQGAVWATQQALSYALGCTETLPTAAPWVHAGVCPTD